MGCIQSITCKARIRRENIVVYDVCATIDQCPTRIEETSPIVLRYKTPYFKASARVVMPPIPRHEIWVVGWIQACNQMEFFNTYSDLGMLGPDTQKGRQRRLSGPSSVGQHGALCHLESGFRDQGLGGGFQHAVPPTAG
ncbi:Protein FAM78B [Pteropus alecto]|uniref:Protein FAM78B n=1 Tax=Pteropus alecto TaxID=9402 RepID=L5KZ91_PTEAL|nr:Protein FAM78B [Pteropus alecto]